MNTKIIVALVIGIAVIGLTGAASAADAGDSESITETYKLVKIVNGDDMIDIGKVISGTYFFEEPVLEDRYSELMGIIENTLVDTWGTAVTPCSDPFKATLVQEGTIKVDLDYPDYKDLPNYDLYALKSQDLIVKGQFTKYGATFKDCATVGINYWDPLDNENPGGITGCGNCQLVEESNAHAWVQATDKVAQGAMFAEAAMGTESYTSVDAVECVNACEEAVLMEGGSMAYAKFFGESIVPESGEITTHADVQTTHGWNDNAGWSHEPPLCP